MPKEGEKIYCLKCKRYTDTLHPHVRKLQVKGHTKYQVVGTCAVCGSKKSKFVSTQHGEGLLGKILGMPNGQVPVLSQIPIVGPLLF